MMPESRYFACRCCRAVLRDDEPTPHHCGRCGGEVKLVAVWFAEAIAEIEVAKTPLMGPSGKARAHWVQPFRYEWVYEEDE